MFSVISANGHGDVGVTISNGKGNSVPDSLLISSDDLHLPRRSHSCSDGISGRDSASDVRAMDDQLETKFIIDYNGVDERETVQTSNQIEEAERSRIIRAIQRLRMNKCLSIKIANMAIEKNQVTVRFLRREPIGHQETDGKVDMNKISRSTTEELSHEGQDDSSAKSISIKSNAEDGEVKKHVTLIKDTLLGIVPHANIVISELVEKPRFQFTAGLRSELVQIDRNRNSRGVGCVTALLINCSNVKDFALTVGHSVSVGESVYIRKDGQNRKIGVVQQAMVNNGVEDDSYVDAALIRLDDDVIKDLSLTQSFLIDGVSHRLSTSAVQPAEAKRVVLRAINQHTNDDKGYISDIYFNIFADSDDDSGNSMDMLNCIQIKKYKKNGLHNGSIHSFGESGLLCTYESNPDLPGLVKPVLMVVAKYAFKEADTSIPIETESSIGVDLHRVLKRFTHPTGEQLTINSIDI